MCNTVPPLAPSQGRLVSRYGVRPARRPPHLPTFHAGIDLSIGSAPVGTVPVYCVAGGSVAVIGRNEETHGGLNGYGNCVAIHHMHGGLLDAPVWTFYAHMQRFSFELGTLSIGDIVPLGMRLGFVGNSTNGKFPGMGPHLHFEVRHGGSGGATPYPGPYPRLTASGQLYNPLNLDPQAWLEARGVRFGRRGAIICEPPNACDPSAVNQIALR